MIKFIQSINTGPGDASLGFFTIIDNNAFYTTFSVEFCVSEKYVQFTDDLTGDIYRGIVGKFFINGAMASTDAVELEQQLRELETNVLTINDITDVAVNALTFKDRDFGFKVETTNDAVEKYLFEPTGVATKDHNAIMYVESDGVANIEAQNSVWIHAGDRVEKDDIVLTEDDDCQVNIDNAEGVDLLAVTTRTIEGTGIIIDNDWAVLSQKGTGDRPVHSIATMADIGTMPDVVYHDETLHGAGLPDDPLGVVGDMTVHHDHTLMGTGTSTSLLRVSNLYVEKEVQYINILDETVVQTIEHYLPPIGEDPAILITEKNNTTNNRGILKVHEDEIRSDILYTDETATDVKEVYTSTMRVIPTGSNIMANCNTSTIIDPETTHHKIFTSFIATFANKDKGYVMLRAHGINDDPDDVYDFEDYITIGEHDHSGIYICSDIVTVKGKLEAEDPQDGIVQGSEFITKAYADANYVDTGIVSVSTHSELYGDGTPEEPLGIKYDNYSLHKGPDGRLTVSDYEELWEEVEALNSRMNIMHNADNCIMLVYPVSGTTQADRTYYVISDFDTKNIYVHVAYADDGEHITQFTYKALDYELVEIVFVSQPARPFEVKIERWKDFDYDFGSEYIITYVSKTSDIDGVSVHSQTSGSPKVKEGDKVMFIATLDHEHYEVAPNAWSLIGSDDSDVSSWIIRTGFFPYSSGNPGKAYCLVEYGDKNITVDVTPSLSDDYNAYLRGFLLINNLAITPTFDQGIFEYEMEDLASWDYGNVTIEAEKGTIEQTVVRTVDSTDPSCSGRVYPNINHGKTKIKFVVTSKNGLVTYTYYVVLKKAANSSLLNFTIGIDNWNGDLTNLACRGEYDCASTLAFTKEYSGTALLSDIVINNIPAPFSSENSTNRLFMMGNFQPSNRTGAKIRVHNNIYEGDESDLIITSFVSSPNGYEKRTYNRIWQITANGSGSFVISVEIDIDGITGSSSYNVEFNAISGELPTSGILDASVFDNIYIHYMTYKNWKNGGMGQVYEVLHGIKANTEHDMPQIVSDMDFSKLDMLVLGGASSGSGANGGSHPQCGREPGAHMFKSSALENFFKVLPHYRGVNLKRYIGAGGGDSGGTGCGPNGNISWVRYVGQPTPNANELLVVKYNICVATQGACNNANVLGFRNSSAAINTDIAGMSLNYSYTRCGNSGGCMNQYRQGDRWTGQGGHAGYYGPCYGPGARGAGGNGNVLMSYPIESVTPGRTNFFVSPITSTTQENYETMSGMTLWVKDSFNNTTTVEIINLDTATINDQTGKFFYAMLAQGNDDGTLRAFYGTKVLCITAVSEGLPNVYVGIKDETPQGGETKRCTFGMYQGTETNLVLVEWFMRSTKTGEVDTITTNTTRECNVPGRDLTMQWTNTKFMKGYNSSPNGGYKCWTLALTVNTIYVPEP